MALSDRNQSIHQTSAGPDRLARRLYITGSVVFILVGLAHTATQLTTLSEPKVRAAYRAGGLIEVNGATIDGWELFAGTSLLMGFYGVAFGAANLVTLYRGRGNGGLPPAGTCIVSLAMLAGVTLVGVLHLGLQQILGGAFGLVLFGVPLWRIVRPGARAAV